MYRFLSNNRPRRLLLIIICPKPSEYWPWTDVINKKGSLIAFPDNCESYVNIVKDCFNINKFLGFVLFRLCPHYTR